MQIMRPRLNEDRKIGKAAELRNRGHPPVERR
jgi:hypothetical protein